MKKPLVLVIGFAVLIVAALAFAFARLPTGHVSTSPRLISDRDRIDIGQVPYNQMVKAEFRLTNGGDQPLKIVGEPQIEVVKGC